MSIPSKVHKVHPSIQSMSIPRLSSLRVGVGVGIVDCFNAMGQQFNKTEKRRRRKAYERRKAARDAAAKTAALKTTAKKA